MVLSFYKMTGAGNDFVMVGNRDLAYSEILTHDNIAGICNRRFGVGADGPALITFRGQARVDE